MAVFTENTPVRAEMPNAACRRWLAEHLHRHDYREILLVEKGTCPVILGEQTCILRAGDMALLESMQPHSNGHLPDPDGLYWWFSFWSSGITLIQWGHNRVEARELLSSVFLHDFMYQLWEEFRQTDAPDAAEDLARQCRLIGKNFLLGRLRSQETLSASGRESAMRKILQYMEDMPSLNCTLDTLAPLAGVSRVHFQRLFLAYTGERFRDYLCRKRRERYLLYHDRLPQKELADRLGFGSTAAFLHWKKRCGE